MPIRIPPKADPDTRNAFNDIEKRLRAIEEANRDRSEVVAPVAEKPARETLVELPETHIAGDLRVEDELVVGGPVDAPYLYEGLIKVVPQGTGDNSFDSRVINMAASLAIAPGGLSADSIHARKANFPRPTALWRRTTNQALTTDQWTTPTYDTFSSSQYMRGVGVNKIYAPESGWYLTGFSVTLEDNATGYRAICISHNGAAQPAETDIVVSHYFAVDTGGTGNVNRLKGCVGIALLGVDDALSSWIWHNVGSDLDLIGGFRSPRFWAVKVSD